MNWQHIDPPATMQAVFGNLGQDAGLDRGVLHVGDLSFGIALGRRGQHPNATVHATGNGLMIRNVGRLGRLLTGINAARDGLGRDALVIVPRQPACAIGFELSFFSKGSQRSPRKEIQITFFDENGKILDIQTRWAAGGTTRQAFKPSTGEQPIAAVKIEPVGTHGIGLRSAKAQACSVLIG